MQAEELKRKDIQTQYPGMLSHLENVLLPTSKLGESAQGLGRERRFRKNLKDLYLHLIINSVIRIVVWGFKGVKNLGKTGREESKREGTFSNFKDWASFNAQN